MSIRPLPLVDLPDHFLLHEINRDAFAELRQHLAERDPAKIPVYIPPSGKPIANRFGFTVQGGEVQDAPLIRNDGDLLRSERNYGVARKMLGVIKGELRPLDDEVDGDYFVQHSILPKGIAAPASYPHVDYRSEDARGVTLMAVDHAPFAIYSGQALFARSRLRSMEEYRQRLPKTLGKVNSGIGMEEERFAQDVQEAASEGSAEIHRYAGQWVLGADMVVHEAGRNDTSLPLDRLLVRVHRNRPLSPRRSRLR